MKSGSTGATGVIGKVEPPYTPYDRAAIRKRMDPEARAALEALEKARRALSEHTPKLRAAREALAERAAASEAIYGIRLTGGIGKAVKAELDEARRTIARRGAP